jgi:transcriptional regulator with XRE-family HTH domain
MNELHARFGELLKIERERRGLALSAVSSELKIPEDTLLKVETGQADALPPGPYLALFSKSYAEFLGIDYSKTIEALREELGEALEPPPLEGAAQTEAAAKPEKPVTEQRVAEARTPRKKVGLVVAGIVVVTTLIVGTFLIFWGNKEVDPSQSDVITYYEDSAHLRQDTTAFPTDVQRFEGDSTALAGPDSLRLTITAHDGSWATIIADADTALFQMLTPERPYNVSAGERLIVTIGVPEVVDVLLDGYPANLIDAATGDISRVLIDHDNRDQFFNHPETDSAADSVAGAGRSGTVRP